MVVCGESGCIRVKVVVLGKVGVFGQCGCIRAKWLYLGKNCFNSAKVVVSGKGGSI